MSSEDAANAGLVSQYNVVTTQTRLDMLVVCDMVNTMVFVLLIARTQVTISR